MQSPSRPGPGVAGVNPWQVWRGEPEPPEPLHDAAERILSSGGVVVTEHGDDLSPFVFEITDKGVSYKAVADSHGRQLQCDCGTAMLTGGRCAHVRALRLWFERRNAPEPEPEPGPPRPFAIW